MEKTIQIFTLTSADKKTTASFSTNAKAKSAQQVLEKFGVKTELEKVKKVIELD